DKMISIGLDIGSYSVKVAVLEGSGKGFAIQSLAEYPLSQDPNRDRTIELVEIFRSIQQKYSGTDAIYVTGAQQDRVSVRRKQFPFRERHKILKSLPFELEEDIPFSSENSVFDFRTSYFVGNTAHVIACACPKEYLRTFLQKIEDAQLYPDIVSVEGIALANAFEEQREAPLEFSTRDQSLPEASAAELVFHIGHHSTTILVLRDGYLLEIRQIDWGGKDLGEVIASKYSMAYTEALKELKRKAFILTNNEGATREQIALSEVIKSSVDKLSHEIQLILLEIKNAYNLSFRSAQLSGGVALSRNLGPYLTQKLELPVNRLNSLAIAPDVNFAASPNNEISFVTAIGLSLEGLKRPKNPAINFLKSEFARKSEAMRMVWERWRVATMTIAAAFFILFTWS
ncbi:MAG: pilus assembly protein PilM, partial [Bdellovibrionota bacterium]